MRRSRPSARVAAALPDIADGAADTAVQVGTAAVEGGHRRKDGLSQIRRPSLVLPLRDSPEEGEELKAARLGVQQSSHVDVGRERVRCHTPSLVPSRAKAPLPCLQRRPRRRTADALDLTSVDAETDVADTAGVDALALPQPTCRLARGATRFVTLRESSTAAAACVNLLHACSLLALADGSMLKTGTQGGGEDVLSLGALLPSPPSVSGEDNLLA